MRDGHKRSKVKSCQIVVICGQIDVMPNTSTPAQYILILIDMVEQQGCDREKLLAGTTLAEYRYIQYWRSYQ